MTLTKRQKITITVILLSIGLFLLPSINVVYRLWVLAGLVLLSYVACVWALLTPKAIYESLILRGKEISYDVTGVEYITLFALPVFLTLTYGVYFFQFVPSTAVSVLATSSYAVVLYVILLVENIFNVSAARSIPLLRAAHTVGYLTTLFVAFVFFSLLWGLGIDGWLTALVVLIVSILLFFQAFWQIKLEDNLSFDIAVYSLVAGVGAGEIAWMLSFWPLQPFTFGLSEMATLYVILGVVQHKMKGNLTRRAVVEYLFVGLAIFLLLLAITSWGA